MSPIVLFINSLVRFVSPGAAFADSLVRIACRRLWELSPGTSKTVPGFPRPEIVFAATFYKGFYKGFGTLPFSRNLASPAQVSPDGFRSFILLTVSDGIVCFVSPIALFIDSIVRLLVLALLLLTVSSGIVCFVSPIVLFIDSIVCFASSGAVFADSLEGIKIE